jgi:integrase/recombinase XerD
MTTFTEVWEQFAYHCRVKRRSSNTLTYYGTTAKALAGFLETEGIADLEHLSVTHLRAYLDHLEQRGLGPGGLHAHARAVKAIFNWACREELLARNPALRLERPSVPKVRLPTVTPEIVSRLIGTSRDGDQPQRDAALILTLFDTGVRVSELTALRLEDLQFERGLIRVQGKGDKQRMVPIGSSAITAVTRYQRRERRPPAPASIGCFWVATAKL